MTKIIVNCRFLTQKITGVQRFAIEICKRLPEEIGGRKVVFVTPKGDIKFDVDSKIELIQFGKFNGQLWEQIDLPLFLQKKGSPLLINFVGIGPVFYKNKISFLYDLAFKHHPEWFSKTFGAIYNTLIPISVRNSNLIVTDSNFVKKDISSSYNISENKIKTIYAGASEIFKYLNLPKENIILTVSSIDPRKNLLRVIKAFNKIETDYKLIIVGKRNKSFSNVDFDRELMNENIIFAGYLEDDELVKLYNKASVFIYASLFEGFGIPPLEAQSCGTPCIVSNTTSLPEVYLNSVVYCDPYSINDIRNRLNELIEDKGKQEKLVKKGFENVERFSWNDSAKKIEKLIYEESINP